MGSASEVEVLVRAELPPGADLDALASLVAYVLSDADSDATPWTVAVSLVGDDELRELHRDFMAIDEVTDVMTFPADLEPGMPGNGGDIVISVDRAAAQGPEHGHDAWQEIRFLAAHGALHLRGWDDATTEQRSAMHAEQARLIERFDSRS